MGITLTRSTDIYTCARLLPDVYRSLERKSRRERSLCHLQIISMINCSGNKIPLACVFAAIAIVFIHGLSLAVAPGEPEVREPEARAWATAEHERRLRLRRERRRHGLHLRVLAGHPSTHALTEYG